MAVSKSIAAKLPFKREQSELARGLPSGRQLSKSCISIVIISFLRFEDCRIGKDHARTYLVKKHVGRSSAAVINYLYDNSAYVLGYSDKAGGKEQLYFDTFKAQIENMAEAFPDSNEILAVRAFLTIVERRLFKRSRRIHCGKTSRKICQRNTRRFLLG